MAKKETDPAGTGEEGKVNLVPFRFSRTWVADHGTYHAGTEKELPEEIALSLEAEGMGELI